MKIKLFLKHVIYYLAILELLIAFAFLYFFFWPHKYYYVGNYYINNISLQRINLKNLNVDQKNVADRFDYYMLCVSLKDTNTSNIHMGSFGRKSYQDGSLNFVKNIILTDSHNKNLADKLKGVQFYKSTPFQYLYMKRKNISGKYFPCEYIKSLDSLKTKLSHMDISSEYYNKADSTHYVTSVFAMKKNIYLPQKLVFGLTDNDGKKYYLVRKINKNPINMEVKYIVYIGFIKHDIDLGNLY